MLYYIPKSRINLYIALFIAILFVAFVATQWYFQNSWRYAATYRNHIGSEYVIRGNGFGGEPSCPKDGQSVAIRCVIMIGN